MNVRVKCFTGMRRYAPEGRGEFALALAEGAQVAQLLVQLNVPVDAGTFIAVNGVRVVPDQVLREGDTVVLFTPMDGG